MHTVTSKAGRGRKLDLPEILQKCLVKKKKLEQTQKNSSAAQTPTSFLRKYQITHVSKAECECELSIASFD